MQFYVGSVIRGLTTIMITHNPDLAGRAGRTVKIKDGRLCPELLSTLGWMEWVVGVAVKRCVGDHHGVESLLLA
jgi:ABC-type lipoprotein export system ATPase subunit